MGVLGLSEDQRLGLLAAAMAAFTSKGGAMNALGQGGQAGLLAMQGAQQGRKQDEKDQMALDMQRMQMSILQQKVAQEQAQQAMAEKSAQAQQAEQQNIAQAGQDPFAAYADTFGRTGAMPKFGPVEALTAQMGAAGNPATKKILGELADKFRPKFGDAKVGMQDGAPVFTQFSDQGGERVVRGLTPPPDNQVVALGDRAAMVDKLTGRMGSAMPYGQSPDNKATVTATMRGQDMVNARSRDANALQAAGSVGKAADELRKEFNALPQVKAYGEVQPVLQSAREAMGTDTAAADLNLIYAAAKIFDPTSVVRESETNMVVQAGSPANRFLGQFNYVAGGGRLTPAARAQLLTQIESRAKGYESGYGSARKAYEGIAKQRSLPGDQIFVEPFATSKKDSATSDKKPAQVKSDADYNSLPSGAEYVAPDGSVRRKK